MECRGYFNSIKVRLKHPELWRVYARGLTFQFHKGTIKTSSQPAARQRYANFNSIKVRLKPAPRNNPAIDLNTFQFHKGTIKTFATVCKEDVQLISIP